MEEDLFRLLVDLEKSLHVPEVRGSKEKLDALLHEDMIEIGMSGRLYDKSRVIETVLQEVPGVMRVRDFSAKLLSGDLALLIYKLEYIGSDKVRKDSMRSSVWKHENGEWKLIFHQGTFYPEGTK